MLEEGSMEDKELEYLMLQNLKVGGMMSSSAASRLLHSIGHARAKGQEPAAGSPANEVAA